MTTAAATMTTYTIQYRQDGQTTYDDVDARDRGEARRVFARRYPRAQVLVVREN